MYKISRKTIRLAIRSDQKQHVGRVQEKVYALFIPCPCRYENRKFARRWTCYTDRISVGQNCKKLGKCFQPCSHHALMGSPTKSLNYVVLKMWPDFMVSETPASGRKFFLAYVKNIVWYCLGIENEPLNNSSSRGPICLINTMGKLLESVLLQRLKCHIDRRSDLLTGEYGFREKQSTVDAITKI